MGFLDTLGPTGVLSGVSALGSLFGGKKSYGSTADLSSGRGYLSALGGISNQYGQQANTAFGNYSTDNGQYRAATQGYADYLKADPNTDAYSTALLARSGAGSADAYSRARANLMASGAGRGVGGAGSSGLIGGFAGIEASQAGNLANAQNEIALNAVQQHAQNLHALMSLWNNTSSQDYGRGNAALQQEQGVDQDLSQQYLRLGEQEQGMEQNQQNQQDGVFGSALGGLASLYGSRAGYGDGSVTGFGYSNPGLLPSSTPIDYSGMAPQFPSINTPLTYARRG